MGPSFVIGTVNLLDVLGIVVLSGLAVVVLVRGRGERWSVYGAVGFGLLTLSRLSSFLALQWYLHADGSAQYERVRIFQWTGALSLTMSVAGFVLLCVALLSGRRSERERARTVPVEPGQPVG